MAKESKKKSKPKKTSLREEQFPYEYVIDLNGKQAAMRCGCPEAGAAVTATRWLKKANIQNKINELQEAQKKKALLTAEELDLRLAALNRTTVKDFFKKDGTPKAIHELTDEQAACVKEIGQIGPAGKLGPTKLVDFHQTLRTGMQRLGMLKDGADKLADTFEKWLDSVHGEKGT